MNNDKISERLDEHEKRIFFNNSFAKNKTDELQSSLSELETTVETTTTSIETIQTELETAETSLSELETLTQTHTSEIAELTTENETSTANITNLQTAQTQTQTALTTAQNSITNLQTNLGTAETSITNLQTAQTQTQTALDTAEDAITDHETRITDVETEISNIQPVNVTNLNTRITSAETDITILQTDLNTAEDTITDHETRITTLESSNTTPLPDYYGTSVNDITNLEEDCEEEPFYNNGDTYSLELGTKYANGPKCTLFTRVNPNANANFTGIIKFEFSNIPANQTSFAVNIWKNGTQIATATQLPLITGQTHQAEYSFNFPASEITEISQVFKIEFADPLLAEMILDRITITASCARNFMLLNRNYNLSIFSNVGSPPNYRKSYLYSYKNGAVHYSANIMGNLTIDPIPNTVANVSFPNHKHSIIYRFETGNSDYSPNNIGVRTVIAFQVAICGENNALYSGSPAGTAYYNIKSHLLQNVNQADISVYNNLYNKRMHIIGIKNDGQPFIINTISQTTLFTPFVLNNIELPNEFVNVVAYTAYQARHLNNTKAGYFMVHKTGHILFFPDFTNAEYFIDLGIGTQANAFLQNDNKTINVYYRFGSNVICKKLYYELSTNKWVLKDFIKIYENYQEIYEIEDDKFFTIRNFEYAIENKT